LKGSPPGPKWHIPGSRTEGERLHQLSFRQASNYISNYITLARTQLHGSASYKQGWEILGDVAHGFVFLKTKMKVKIWRQGALS
jgi:hypothetical protein